jgi:hypothetical protein
MSDRTKLILAVTLGSVGLALGILGTVVAFNARNAVRSNQEIASLVQAEFAEAQKRQDQLEESQVSGAEKLVDSLSRSEKNQPGKIYSNAKATGRLRRRVNNQQGQIDALKSTTRQLSGQVSNLQSQTQKNFNTLNDRIDRTNQRIDNR